MDESKPKGTGRHPRLISERHIRESLAQRGIFVKYPTWGDVERALLDLRQQHPDAIFTPRLANRLAYIDFALSNRAQLSRAWERAKDRASDWRQWDELALKFDMLSERETVGLQSGEYKQRLNIYGNYLHCSWHSNEAKDIAVRFEVLAAHAGRLLGHSSEIEQAVRQTIATGWADFWKYCLWLHLGDESESINTDPIRSSADFCRHLEFRNINPIQRSVGLSDHAQGEGRPEPIALTEEHALRLPARACADSDLWRARRSGFDALLARQRSLLVRDTHKEWLKASYNFAAEHGKFGRHRRTGGLDSDLISRFEDLATQGAYALGCPPDIEPIDFWIYSLIQDLFKAQDPKFRVEFVGDEGIGFIQGLLESSVCYCSRLAARAERYTAKVGSVPLAGNASVADTAATGHLRVAEGQLERVGESSVARPKRKRGRPTKFSDDLKQAALNARGGKARAQILYATKFPTPQQVKNVAAILRHFKRKRAPQLG